MTWNKTPTHWSWVTMRQRCNNPNAPKYVLYGGRGITVCERWNSFGNFLVDMGERPEGMTLDRIDNDGNYEPSNCRWADKYEQRHNQRNMKLSREDVAWIRENRHSFSQAEIARRLRIDPSHVSKILSGQVRNG